jgi:hypothetical protein
MHSIIKLIILVLTFSGLNYHVNAALQMAWSQTPVFMPGPNILNITGAANGCREGQDTGNVLAATIFCHLQQLVYSTNRTWPAINVLTGRNRLFFSVMGGPGTNCRVHVSILSPIRST